MELAPPQKKKKLFVIDQAYKSCCFNNTEQLPVGYNEQQGMDAFQYFQQ
jgi:hypothetical protein